MQLLEGYGIDTVFGKTGRHVRFFHARASKPAVERVVVNDQDMGHPIASSVFCEELFEFSQNLCDAGFQLWGR